MKTIQQIELALTSEITAMRGAGLEVGSALDDALTFVKEMAVIEGDFPRLRNGIARAAAKMAPAAPEPSVYEERGFISF